MNKIQKFYNEYKNWKNAGSPLRTKEKIGELFEICSNCPEYIAANKNRGMCGICGCNLKREGKVLNKLAWATTRCPLEEPKWVEETNIEMLDKAEEDSGGDCGCGK